MSTKAEQLKLKLKKQRINAAEKLKNLKFSDSTDIQDVFGEKPTENSSLTSTLNVNKDEKVTDNEPQKTKTNNKKSNNTHQTPKKIKQPTGKKQQSKTSKKQQDKDKNLNSNTNSNDSTVSLNKSENDVSIKPLTELSMFRLSDIANEDDMDLEMVNISNMSFNTEDLSKPESEVTSLTSETEESTENYGNDYSESPEQSMNKSGNEEEEEEKKETEKNIIKTTLEIKQSKQSTTKKSENLNKEIYNIKTITNNDNNKTKFNINLESNLNLKQHRADIKFKQDSDSAIIVEENTEYGGLADITLTNSSIHTVTNEKNNDDNKKDFTNNINRSQLDKEIIINEKQNNSVAKSINFDNIDIIKGILPKKIDINSAIDKLEEKKDSIEPLTLSKSLSNSDKKEDTNTKNKAKDSSLPIDKQNENLITNENKNDQYYYYYYYSLSDDNNMEQQQKLELTKRHAYINLENGTRRHSTHTSASFEENALTRSFNGHKLKISKHTIQKSHRTITPGPGSINSGLSITNQFCQKNQNDAQFYYITKDNLVEQQYIHQKQMQSENYYYTPQENNYYNNLNEEKEQLYTQEPMTLSQIGSIVRKIPEDTETIINGFINIRKKENPEITTYENINENIIKSEAQTENSAKNENREEKTNTLAESVVVLTAQKQKIIKTTTEINNKIENITEEEDNALVEVSNVKKLIINNSPILQPKIKESIECPKEEIKDKENITITNKSNENDIVSENSNEKSENLVLTNKVMIPSIIELEIKKEELIKDKKKDNENMLETYREPDIISIIKKPNQIPSNTQLQNSEKVENSISIVKPIIEELKPEKKIEKSQIDNNINESNNINKDEKEEDLISIPIKVSSPIYDDNDKLFNGIDQEMGQYQYDNVFDIKDYELEAQNYETASNKKEENEKKSTKKNTKQIEKKDIEVKIRNITIEEQSDNNNVQSPIKHDSVVVSSKESSISEEKLDENSHSESITSNNEFNLSEKSDSIHESMVATNVSTNVQSVYYNDEKSVYNEKMLCSVKFGRADTPAVRKFIARYYSVDSLVKMHGSNFATIEINEDYERKIQSLENEEEIENLEKENIKKILENFGDVASSTDEKYELKEVPLSSLYKTHKTLKVPRMISYRGEHPIYDSITGELCALRIAFKEIKPNKIIKKKKEEYNDVITKKKQTTRDFKEKHLNKIGQQNPNISDTFLGKKVVSNFADMNFIECQDSTSNGNKVKISNVIAFRNSGNYIQKNSESSPFISQSLWYIPVDSYLRNNIVRYNSTCVESFNPDIISNSSPSTPSTPYENNEDDEPCLLIDQSTTERKSREKKELITNAPNENKVVGISFVLCTSSIVKFTLLNYIKGKKKIQKDFVIRQFESIIIPAEVIFSVENIGIKDAVLSVHMEIIIN